MKKRTQSVIKKSLVLSLLISTIGLVEAATFLDKALGKALKFTGIEDKLVKVMVGRELSHPRSIQNVELFLAIRESEDSEKRKLVALKGAGFSQGEQTYSETAFTVDLAAMNKILAFDSKGKTITVQPGVTWRTIQEQIDTFDLSVAVMQSYNNFTVGGSLSVNVHGRYLGHGPIIETVKSLKVMLADGSIVTASREENYDLFKAVIGGYGAIGIIVEATLALTDNCKLERRAVCLPLADYLEFFASIKKNPDAILHNADLYPPDYSVVTSITWFKTDKAVTIPQRIKPHVALSLIDMIKVGLAKRVPLIQQSRPSLEALKLKSQTVAWRNYEASYHTDELYYPTPFSESLLQEFFVPVDQLALFLEKMQVIMEQRQVNVLNISLRHVAANDESLLSWSPVESFAVVILYDQWKTEPAARNSAICFAMLIDAALSVGGTYYLPYRPVASQKQFEKAYPNHEAFWAVKEKYDPQHVFSNGMLERYFNK